MKKVVLFLILVVTLPATIFAQGRNPVERRNTATGGSGGFGGERSSSRGTQSSEELGDAPVIKQEIKNWLLIDDFTFADSINVDTITTGVQIHNPIFHKSFANIETGNLGSPYQSQIISDQKWSNQFIFYSSLPYYFPAPEDIVFFNTRTPYTNLLYQFGGPKRRSEEVVGVLFTQNINKDFNIGLKYNLFSTTGFYNAQNINNQNIILFSSYSGDKYSINTAFLINNTKQSENGGILNDDYIINSNKYPFEQPENIPVNFTTAGNKINNFRVYINQSLGIGSIKIKKRETDIVKNEEVAVFNDSLKLQQNSKDSINDSINVMGNRRDSLMANFTHPRPIAEEPTALPISTVYYTLQYENDKREYSIDDLQQYMSPNVENPYYENIYIDSLQTRDSVRYNEILNTFQIKFNEEANSLFKFGVRLFISNAIKFYRMPAESFYDPDDREFTPHYRSSDTTLVTSYFGGQIFKNLGKNFWWNAGIKFYFQGYRAGDTEITGKINSSFKISKKDTAGVFAEGGFYATSPELFQNRYFSNHIQWDNDFRAQKTLRLRGGLRMPTRRLELSAELRSLTDHIYWNNDALPAQESGFIQIIELSLSKHFIWARVHSLNKLAYQITSMPEVIPLPDFAGYSSNYYENKLFQVLTFQLGFDLRYHTKYYTPTYMPATGQFHTQNIRKVGNYPFIDLFLNFQLKRARIFVKLDHANQGFTGTDYFHTTGYPANPRSIKFGVSWNFYN